MSRGYFGNNLPGRGAYVHHAMSCNNNTLITLGVSLARINIYFSIVCVQADPKYPLNYSISVIRHLLCGPLATFANNHKSLKHVLLLWVEPITILLMCVRGKSPAISNESNLFRAIIEQTLINLNTIEFSMVHVCKLLLYR
jgi:hypothetical protein